ncbi:cadherin domain-containing protein [Chondrinema litorale]|uniref:cadherin domain-containing protein n=1 Tax=Chondrinema litorale TaxID=2994555 RepID=UPI00254372DE|nr:cadherin domain-containing protein [Chondrinema litorale]UZR98500.1 cadherin domain-containing protein [Chondrinema litorale]
MQKKLIIHLLYFLILGLIIACDEDDPINLAPEVTDQNFTINENSANGTPVGTIQATDQEEETLNFSITNGNTDDAFLLNATSGELTVNNTEALDFESNASFTLTINVSDKENTTTVTVTITITDVNENTAPTIENQQFSIDENSEESTIIGTVAATDAEDDALTFKITDGNAENVFSIDSLSGELSVSSSAALDYEVNPSFALTVEVSDGELTTSAEITILLNDVSPELFTTETEITDALNQSYADLSSYIEYTYLFDAVYTNVITAPSEDWDDISTHSQNSLNTKVNQFWFGAKDIIFVLNNIILSAEEVLPSGEQQNEVIAQAQVMRAYLHFTMLEWFGNIPLELDITPENATQTSPSQLVMHIEAEVNAAIEILPTSWEGNNNYITKDLAKALLARVKLFNNDWSGVLEQATAMVNNGTYSLSDDTESFTKGDTEIIWGFDETGEVTFSNAYTKGNYIPLFRLTESYLMQAEAHIMMGNSADCITALNTLRDRSEQTLLPNGASQSELIGASFDQWQTEMDFGGVSFSTLKRYQKAEDELSIQTYQLLLPIPQTVIDNNPNLFQNMGY